MIEHIWLVTLTHGAQKYNALAEAYSATFQRSYARLTIKITFARLISPAKAIMIEIPKRDLETSIH